MSMQGAPGYQPPGQGSSGGTDFVTALQGIIKQLSSSNKNTTTLNANMVSLIAAIQAVNFPQNVKGYTVATLPSSPAIGTLAYVTDGTSGLAWGATLTGGHTTTYLGWWNGANWTVLGK